MQLDEARIGVVGIGAVGTEMVRILRERGVPHEAIRIMARSERDQEVAGEIYHVVATQPDAFTGLDVVFFAGTEGAKGASRQFGWAAVEHGAVVIDNGSDYRMDDRVPLVVPEVNPEALKQHAGFIANPNCSTIIALVALGPLHRAFGIRRFTAATYQAVSGSGGAAIREWEDQTKALAAGKPLRSEVYPHPIVGNVLPAIGGEAENMPGYTTEEAKMLFETRKILGTDTIRVSATCVRVPVANGHSEALHVEFERPVTPEAAREVLRDAPGVRIADDLAAGVYPMPLDASGIDEVLVGRIRNDPSAENGLCLFVAGDNIRKGAALNAVQIAEIL